MVGALVAVLLLERDLAAEFGVTTRNVLSLAGLVMVLGSFVFLDERTPLPSLYSLIPVVGTALLLIAATSDTWVGRILSSKPFVLVGLLSYSIYLWHVPLLSFSKAILPEPPGLAIKLLLLTATFLLAIATWKFVETPFRQRHVFGRRTILIGAVVASGAFAAVGSAIALNDGFRDRFSSYYLSFELNRERSATWKYVDQYLKDTQSRPLTQSKAPGVTPYLKVGVIGNSHAKDLFNALYLADLKVNLQPLISNRLCRKFPQRSSRREACDYGFIFPNMKWDADRYIIAPRWTEGHISALPKVLNRLAKLGKPVAVFGNTAEFADVPRYFAKRVKLVGNDSEPTLRLIEQEVSQTLKLSWLGQTNKRIRSIVEHHGAVYFDRLSLICPQHRCTLLDSDLTHILYDNGHTTLRGAEYVSSRLMHNTALMNFIMPSTKQAGSPVRPRDEKQHSVVKTKN